MENSFQCTSATVATAVSISVTHFNLFSVKKLVNLKNSNFLGSAFNSTSESELDSRRKEKEPLECVGGALSQSGRVDLNHYFHLSQ